MQRVMEILVFMLHTLELYIIVEKYIIKVKPREVKCLNFARPDASIYPNNLRAPSDPRSSLSQIIIRDLKF